MKIVVLGGGPAGLYFSILMKRADAAHEMTVIERNPAGATFGFGVVFSERALDYLQSGDPETYRILSEQLVLWDAMELRVRGRTLRCRGIGFSAISRKELLRVLQERARSLGVKLLFEHEVHDLGELDGHDLVVAADGVNSIVRSAYGEAFEPDVRKGDARFIWFGATTPFEGLTFPFVERPDGAWLAAHAYPYENGASTFIVETDDDSWRAFGFDAFAGGNAAPGESDLGSLELCERLFAEHLAGGRLLGNNSKWLRFNTIRNARWRRGNVVLVGDAAHTAHFSIGSGTRLALEDAAALAGALADEAELEPALEAYERGRRPEVENLQEAAAVSEEWWARAGRLLDFGPEQFAFNYFTRTRNFTYQNLLRRDRSFVRSVERAVAEVEQPVLATCRFRDIELQNRLVVVCEGAPEEVAGYALVGIGLVIVSGERTAEEWSRLVAAAHAHGARVGVRVSVPGEEATPAVSGVDVLQIDDLGGFADVRAHWPEDRPVFVRQHPGDVGDLRARGADLLVLGGPQAQAMLAADLVRGEEGFGVSLPAASLDEANTLVLSGRADLVRVGPHLARVSWERPD
jgi:anthraniloyl-CoA monooxygenase